MSATPSAENDAAPEVLTDLYICPSSGETESLNYGGFDVCCNHPRCPGNLAVGERPNRALPPAKCPECGGDLSDGVCPNDAYQRRAIPPALSASDVEAIVRSREKHRANGCKVHDEKFARCTCPIPPGSTQGGAS